MLEFDYGKGSDKNYVLRETEMIIEEQRKMESVMCQGNGYMCIRAAVEEEYERNDRRCLVAGTFTLPADGCPDLPNCADFTRIEISLNGETVNIYSGKLENYSRTLNLRTGLLTRSFTWTAQNGSKADFCFERVVSLDDFHVFAEKVTVVPASDTKISVLSGVDCDTIHCNENFLPVEKYVKDDILSVASQTSQSLILFMHSTRQRVYVNGEKADCGFTISSNAPKTVLAAATVDVEAGNTYTFVKVANLFTNRDKELNECSLSTLREVALVNLKKYDNASFEQIAAASAKRWQERIWNERDIKVDTDADFDVLAYRFAIYHLTVMSPTHDNRMNIGAKGLSGPGYRGHSFWDTEVYMLPYFIFSAPNEARSLLEHRYNGLAAAKQNAKGRGYEGAMFPWESAWITDGETTPGGCLTGLLEQHITADVAQGVNSYYIASGDDDFMENYGYEILFETAIFWASRMTFNEEKKCYEILQVIGPDEYKEYVDNNAYTNYLAHLNLQLAVKAYDTLKNERPVIFNKLNEKCGLDARIDILKERMAGIYLPPVNKDGLVPQDDTYLSLTDVCLPDKSISEDGGVARQKAGAIGYDKAQVSKQADIMVLFVLLEDLFNYETKRKNFYYYEKRCFHDSSLSLSTYSMLAADIGEREQAYRLFDRSTRIDLNQDYYGSEPGVHAASLGGIWQCTVMGFGGVRIYGNNLRIQPDLPDKWNSLSFHIVWHGQHLDVCVDRKNIKIYNRTKTEKINIMCDGKLHELDSELTIEYKGLK